VSNRFENKVVVVTGAGRGMGRAIAEAFVDQGAKVMVAARTVSFGEQTVAAFRAKHGQAALCQVDVTKQSDIQRLIQETVRIYGGIDVVVHSAAEVSVNRLVNLSNEEIDLTFTSTIRAAIWLIQAAHQFLAAAKDGGRVIAISSICGTRTAIAGMSHYAAAKAGLNALVANAALELAADRISVNSIEPGITDTDRFREWTPVEEQKRVVAEIPLGRLGRPQEVAHTALFLADPESAYITGRAITIDGGVSLSASSGGQDLRASQ
jgi:3-oxoacyl-[acyl-carrier protein] reductase